MNNNTQNEIIICECNSIEHQLIFSYFKDDEAPTIYTNIHLNKLPFLKRLKYALNYIFGYQSQYGAFDEIIIGDKYLPQFKKLVNYLNGENNTKKLNNPILLQENNSISRINPNKDNIIDSFTITGIGNNLFDYTPYSSSQIYTNDNFKYYFKTKFIEDKIPHITTSINYSI